ncbi:MAG: peptidase prolyl oligopeptidase active site domain protein [Phenylobacterium sp.]|nr:peptidase prolyl oligopeptidase active site domain protein [Phenylobacterium sp.]
MRWIRVVLAAVLGLWAPAAAAAPLEAYGRLPSIEDIAISADATRLAAMVTQGDARRLLVKRLSDGVVEAEVALGKTKARSITWAGRDHLLITTSSTAEIANAYGPRREYFTVVDLDMRDRKLYPLMNNVLNTANVAVGDPIVRQVAGETTLRIPGIGFVDGDYRSRLVLLKADLDRHKLQIDWSGHQHTTGFVVDEQGAVVAETEFDGIARRWTLRVKQGETWREVKKLDLEFDPPALVGAGRSGGTVVVLDRTSGAAAYREISTAQPAWTEPFETLEQVARPMWGLDWRLAGLRELTGDTERDDVFDPAYGRLWSALRATFPGQLIEIASRSAMPGKLVVRVDSRTEGPAYAFVDLDAKRAIWIGSVYQQLAPEDIAPVRSLTFPASDGLQLSGYLTLPVGKPARRLALVVLPHDGPDRRDLPGFDWWAQAIASRGYAVLQVNFRGSRGYGEKFMEAGYGQWGRKMQTDLSDGVRRLVADGTVDPGRVCIVGVNYGGYAALAGVALEPEVYRCAVAVAGIADLRAFLNDQGDFSARWLKRYIGVERIGEAALLAISPAAQVDRIRAPVLLIHGKDDTVVPVSQTYAMAGALRGAGKSVRSEILDGEDHWLSRSETRLRTIRSVAAFLEENNPPN